MTHNTKMVAADLRVLISTHFNVSPAEVVSSARFDTDFGADSLSIVQFFLAVQDKAKIKLPDSSLLSITTVGAILEFFEASACVPDDRNR